ncbi:FAD binding domain-containing protein [Phlyctema vagabunda]|uniref:FAD binding domain-containing protein n=1 Tax=Phlyctema vagabunda TaxID=108571 RepID=A0ABR4P426_9HELO
MDTLVKATLEHGLIPPVVMEFPGITVGGGYTGSAGENSSFKYGAFDESINWVEMILANGDVVTASKSERPDLFKGAARALGTLGITTLYYRTSNIHDTIKAIRNETENPLSDYVDGIIFSKTHAVVITGQLTDEKPDFVEPLTFTGAWDPWYYLHVRDQTCCCKTDEEIIEYVPIIEYLFRYDRGGFWVGAEAFRYFNFVPFNRFTRWFLDDFMHTRMLYRALHGSNTQFGNIVQDLSLPYSAAQDFVEYTSDELRIWPLWLCPLRAIQPPTFHPSTTLPGPSDAPKPMLNIGLWGRASSQFDEFLQQNRQLERKLTELGGRKVLYSQTFYTEQEFWGLYDRGWYEDLRWRYAASSLPTVYDKVRVDVRQQRASSRKLLSWWPFAGMLGIFHAIRSRDYLLHRRPFWRRQLEIWEREKKNHE